MTGQPTDPRCVHCGQPVNQRNLTHACPVVGQSLSTLGCVKPTDLPSVREHQNDKAHRDE